MKSGEELWRATRSDPGYLGRCYHAWLLSFLSLAEQRRFALSMPPPQYFEGCCYRNDRTGFSLGGIVK
jgi:hypothetical protein